jgi:hypothetical protein
VVAILRIARDEAADEARPVFRRFDVVLQVEGAPVCHRRRPIVAPNGVVDAIPASKFFRRSVRRLDFTKVSLPARRRPR